MISQDLNLQLTQSNLQDFVDCPRRFQLKILEKRSWPAAYSLPILEHEKTLELGNQFHNLSQQLFSGIDPDLIQRTILDPDLEEIWQRFLPYAVNLRPLPHFAEQYLSINYLGSRLAAKYDLILLHPDHSIQIIDWKTSPQLPARETAATRVQTYLYPLVFYLGGSELFPSISLRPEAISLSYWYPLGTDPEIRFDYSKILHEEACASIQQLITNLHHLQETNADFPLTEDRAQCRLCPFRSLCDRGAQAGSTDQWLAQSEEDFSGLNFDFEQIMEIEF